MDNNKNFAIGVLSTTAVVMFVGLIVVQSRPAPALASGMTASAGPYVITTAWVSSADEQLVHVIHSVSQKMIVYAFDTRKHNIKIVDTIDLGAMRQVSTGQPQQKKRTGKRRP